MKPKLIILEGTIGSGKSTISTMIRELVPTYTLYRLTGLPKQTDTANKSYIYHLNVLQSIERSALLDMNFVLDRSFISNTIYSRMGLKTYSYENTYELFAVLRRISKFYDVHAINLYCSNDAELLSRLGGRDKFQYVKHDLEQAIRQRDVYHQYFDEMKDADFMTVTEIDTANKTTEEVFVDLMEVINNA